MSGLAIQGEAVPETEVHHREMLPTVSINLTSDAYGILSTTARAIIFGRCVYVEKKVFKICRALKTKANT